MSDDVPYRESFPLKWIGVAFAIVRAGEMAAKANELGYCLFQVESFALHKALPYDPDGGVVPIGARGEQALTAEETAAVRQLHDALTDDDAPRAFGARGGLLAKLLPLFMELLAGLLTK